MSYAQNFLKMDKTDRLLDAIEHPDRYSDTELEAMLADPEVREVYDMLDKTKVTLTPISTPDVDAEWESFKDAHLESRNRKGFSIMNLFSRNIVANIAIGIASLDAVAAVVGVGVNYALKQNEEPTTSETAKVEKRAALPSDTITVVEAISEVAPKIIVFDNEPLETIANRIADYYGCKVEFSTDAPKELRLYFR